MCMSFVCRKHGKIVSLWQLTGHVWGRESITGSTEKYLLHITGHQTLPKMLVSLKYVEIGLGLKILEFFFNIDRQMDTDRKLN